MRRSDNIFMAISDSIKMRQLKNDNSIPQDRKEAWDRGNGSFRDMINYPTLRKYVSKAFFRGMPSDDSSFRLIVYMGYKNAIKLFDEYPQFASYLSDFGSPLWFLDSPTSEKPLSYIDAKEKLFADIFSCVTTFGSFANFNAESIPNEMKEKYPSIFIDNDELPQEVLDRYYHGRLTLGDLIEYQDVLKNKNITIGLRENEKLCKGIDCFFGFDIWNIIKHFPKELSNELSIYFNFAGNNLTDDYVFPNDKKVSLDTNYINQIIELALDYIIQVHRRGRKPDDFKEIHLYSKYMPLDKLIDDSVICDFIKRCGIDNLIEFNNNHNNVFDLDHCSFKSMFCERYRPIISLIDKDAPLSNQDELFKAINDAMYKMRLKEYSYSTGFHILLKEFPEHYIDVDLLGSLIQESNISSDILEQIGLSLSNNNLIHSLDDMINGRIVDRELSYISLVNICPELKQLFMDKKILFFKYGSGSFLEGLYNIVGNNLFIEICSKYGQVLQQADYSLIEELKKIDYSKNYEDEFDKYINDYIYNNLFNKKTKYTELYLSLLPESFRKKYPKFFLLDVDIPDEIRNRYLSRQLQVQDFIDNPDLINCFKNVSVLCGFSHRYSWIADLYTDIDNLSFVNNNGLVILKLLDKVDYDTFDVVKIIVEDYVKENPNELLDDNTFEQLVNLSIRLSYSNSIEINLLKKPLLSKLMTMEDPLKIIDEIEKVFLKNNLPLCGKMFKCFKTLYPEYSDIKDSSGVPINFSDESRLAPDFLDSYIPNIGFHSSNEDKRDIIVFNDLLRLSYRSGERSLIEYLDNIEKGYGAFLKVRKDNYSTSNLNDEENAILEVFVNHLETLFYSTKKGKIIQKYTRENKEYGEQYSKMPLGYRLMLYTQEYVETERYTLKDRIVRSFCHFAGIDSFDELKEMIRKSADEQRSRKDQFLEELKSNGGVFRFQEGDFVRGIGYLDALSGSLGTGNYCKEHLGVFRGISYSDTTPLDVDITLIKKPVDPLPPDIYYSISKTPTGFGFGNIYVIIRKDNPNFRITRDSDGAITHSEYDPTKVELFRTGYTTHWGARTGISLADVDCILYKETRPIDTGNMYDENGNIRYVGESSVSDLPAVKFLIAKNGYYIPVIDFSGKLVFTEEEFDMLRSKMQGLSYYGEKNYELSSELIIPDVEQIAASLDENSVNYTNERRKKIYSIIKEAMDELGLEMKYQLDGDLSNGSIEIIDTGSTGRNTNIPYDGDYDFFMRVDAGIIRKPEVFEKFKKLVESKFRFYGVETTGYTSNGDMRLSGVCLDPSKPKEIVKVDISFGVKTNKVRYSSDICLSDRLHTIRELYPDQYKYVVANIILAKKVLKGSNSEEAAYKPHRTDPSQGGLGGIGIENWVLQNGGSFVQACRSFLEAATDKKTGETIPYEDFIRKYEIWDFGENHFTVRNGNIDVFNTKDALGQIKMLPYDNFIFNNLNSTGYKKMIKIIKEYLNKIDLGLFEDDKTL